MKILKSLFSPKPKTIPNNDSNTRPSSSSVSISKKTPPSLPPSLPSSVMLRSSDSDSLTRTSSSSLSSKVTVDNSSNKIPFPRPPQTPPPEHLLLTSKPSIVDRSTPTSSSSISSSTSTSTTLNTTSIVPPVNSPAPKWKIPELPLFKGDHKKPETTIVVYNPFQAGSGGDVVYENDKLLLAAQTQYKKYKNLITNTNISVEFDIQLIHDYFTEFKHPRYEGKHCEFLKIYESLISVRERLHSQAIEEIRVNDTMEDTLKDILYEIKITQTMFKRMDIGFTYEVDECKNARPDNE